MEKGGQVSEDLGSEMRQSADVPRTNDIQNESSNERSEGLGSEMRRTENVRPNFRNRSVPRNESMSKNRTSRDNCWPVATEDIDDAEQKKYSTGTGGGILFFKMKVTKLLESARRVFQFTARK
jgi:hypothetical protein